MEKTLLTLKWPKNGFCWADPSALGTLDTVTEPLLLLGLGVKGLLVCRGSRTQAGSTHSHCLEEEDCFFLQGHRLLLALVGAVLPFLLGRQEMRQDNEMPCATPPSTPSSALPSTIPWPQSPPATLCPCLHSSHSLLLMPPVIPCP